MRGQPGHLIVGMGFTQWLCGFCRDETSPCSSSSAKGSQLQQQCEASPHPQTASSGARPQPSFSFSHYEDLTTSAPGSPASAGSGASSQASSLIGICVDTTTTDGGTAGGEPSPLRTHASSQGAPSSSPQQRPPSFVDLHDPLLSLQLVESWQAMRCASSTPHSHCSSSRHSRSRRNSGDRLYEQGAPQQGQYHPQQRHAAAGELGGAGSGCAACAAAAAAGTPLLAPRLSQEEEDSFASASALHLQLGLPRIRAPAPSALLASPQRLFDPSDSQASGQLAQCSAGGNATARSCTCSLCMGYRQLSICSTVATPFDISPYAGSPGGMGVPCSLDSLLLGSVAALPPAWDGELGDLPPGGVLGGGASATAAAAAAAAGAAVYPDQDPPRMFGRSASYSHGHGHSHSSHGSYSHAHSHSHSQSFSQAATPSARRLQRAHSVRHMSSPASAKSTPHSTSSSRHHQRRYSSAASASMRSSLHANASPARPLPPPLPTVLQGAVSCEPTRHRRTLSSPQADEPGDGGGVAGGASSLRPQRSRSMAHITLPSSMHASPAPSPADAPTPLSGSPLHSDAECICTPLGNSPRAQLSSSDAASPFQAAQQRHHQARRPLGTPGAKAALAVRFARDEAGRVVMQGGTRPAAGEPLV